MRLSYFSITTLLILSLFSQKTDRKNVTVESNMTDTINEFTAIINGSLWKANNVTAKYYEGSLSIYGENDEYFLSINRFRIKNGKQDADCYLTDKNNNLKHWLELLNSNLNVIELNLQEGYITATFEFSCKINYQTFEKPIDYRITNGKINTLKFSPIFCCPNYEIKTGSFEKFGIWNLVKIYDNNLDTTYYPVCSRGATLNLRDTIDYAFSNADLSYEHPLVAYAGCNILRSSYSILNDSTIVTSHGSMTSLGCEEYINDYEDLYYRTLTNDTFLIDINNNIMKLTSNKGKELTYYK